MADIVWDGTDLDNDYAAAGNFVGGALPADTDTVTVPAMAQADTTDISGGTGAGYEDIELASFTILEGCYTKIGTAGVSPTYLNVDAAIANLAPKGVTFLRFNDTAVNPLNITAAPSAPSVGKYGLTVDLISAAATATNISTEAGQSVGLSALVGESGTYDTIRISGGGTTTIGSGTTVTTLTIGNGIVYMQSAATTISLSAGTLTHTGGAITTLNVYGGTCDHEGSGIVANLNVYGGTCDYKGANNITNVTVYNGAMLDLHNDLRTKTIVTSLKLYKGSTLDMRGGHVAIPTITLQGCTLGDVTIYHDPSDTLSFA